MSNVKSEDMLQNSKNFQVLGLIGVIPAQFFQVLGVIATPDTGVIAKPHPGVITTSRN